MIRGLLWLVGLLKTVNLSTLRLRQFESDPHLHVYAKRNSTAKVRKMAQSSTRRFLMSFSSSPGSFDSSCPAYPKNPWRFSPKTYSKLCPSSQNSYRTYELLPSDPEYDFVLKRFYDKQPTNRALKRIVCIHQPKLSSIFENTIPIMEAQADQDAFRPNWEQEKNRSERERAMTRFESLTRPFSPFAISSENRKEIFQRVKILPVWHGTSRSKCESIFQSGLTYFGKHGYDGIDAKNPSKDVGYFGSGIYFTTSARYADIYSDGENLLFGWISMRYPYPVISDVAPPQKGSDMRKLEGKGAFENYNAHYTLLSLLIRKINGVLSTYLVIKNKNPIVMKLSFSNLLKPSFVFGLK